MVMKNGKIVLKKKKAVEPEAKVKKVKKKSEPKPEPEKKVKKKSEPKPEPEKKAKPKKTRKETSAPEHGYIKLGEHSFLTVELATDDNNKQVVAFRKFYTTKTDSEKKQARGGFNMQASGGELKLLAGVLKQLAKEIEEG